MVDLIFSHRSQEFEASREKLSATKFRNRAHFKKESGGNTFSRKHLSRVLTTELLHQVQSNPRYQFSRIFQAESTHSIQASHQPKNPQSSFLEPQTEKCTF